MTSCPILRFSSFHNQHYASALYRGFYERAKVAGGGGQPWVGLMNSGFARDTPGRGRLAYLLEHLFGGTSKFTRRACLHFPIDTKLSAGTMGSACLFLPAQAQGARLIGFWARTMPTRACGRSRSAHHHASTSYSGVAVCFSEWRFLPELAVLVFRPDTSHLTSRSLLFATFSLT